MATKKISELTDGSSSITVNDYLPVVQGGTTKKVTVSSVRAEYEIDALNVYGSGTSFTQATIEAALTAIGTVNKAILLLRSGAWVISSNADWSAYANVTFKFAPGATLSHGTYTIKFATPPIIIENTNTVSQSPSPYFSGTGIVYGYPGPLGIGGTDFNTLFNVGGQATWAPNPVTGNDSRMIGILGSIQTYAGYSSEGINNRPSFKMPVSGAAASVEGYHLDLANIDWSGAGTINELYGVRVRGVPLNAKVGTATAIFIEAGFGTNATVANYNILSAGITNRNRFDGYMEVYGLNKHTIGNGSAPVTYIGLIVDPTPGVAPGGSGTDYSALMRIGQYGSVNPGVGQSGYGLIVSPTIVEAASGTHENLVGVELRPPVITVGAATVDRMTTLKITGAPVGTTNYGNFALWIDSGIVRWDDYASLGGGAVPTFGTIGGSGPAAAGQARWLRVNIDGTNSFIPVWQ